MGCIDVRFCCPLGGEWDGVVPLKIGCHLSWVPPELVEVVFCPLVVGDYHIFGRGLSFNKAGSFFKSHDEQLKYDNPSTSKNSDGFNL